MEKCVIIVDSELSTGVIANVSAVLSMSIGYKVEGLVGADIRNADGHIHHGLTQLPIPVLGTTAGRISDIKTAMASDSNDEILVFDFNNLSQKAKTYEEYISLIESSAAKDIVYLGIALYGNKKTINKITSGLSLVAKD